MVSVLKNRRSVARNSAGREAGCGSLRHPPGCDRHVEERRLGMSTLTSGGEVASCLIDTLYSRLATAVQGWRNAAYAHDQYPAISEVLRWAGGQSDGPGFLREPQFRALETYWYLRLVEGTPTVFDLYRRAFPADEISTLLDAIGIPDAAFRSVNYDLDKLWSAVEADDEFTRSYGLDSLRETLRLRYPSYILALAMGAGKTILIAAIYATEFAMALEYPSGPFVQNALVFAPGKTIIESLRELTAAPYDAILPPRFSRRFSAALKLTFTRDGERDIPIVRGSAFNVVVTNTEKIRIQKETIRRGELGPLLSPLAMDAAKSEVANLRLQAIASLPHLAIFSDEAHHTYGQSLGADLKKVRLTVDYLAEQTNLVCVVNTTGTPYFRRQPLRDVVIWYGLAEGIDDGILKDVAGNIYTFDFEGDGGDSAAYVSYAVADFFQNYGNVMLPNGAPAKLAMYFPKLDDLTELKPYIQRAVIDAGHDPSICLVNTSASSREEIDAFNRLNRPDSPHRVILLVNKGTEGWNCPSLFACALVRRIRSSNNFVLQAASRCLRQVPGNTRSARIYLSADNFGTLDRELTETYGHTISDLRNRRSDRLGAVLVVRKTTIPPVVVKVVRQRIVRKGIAPNALTLERPSSHASRMTRTAYQMIEYQTARRVLQQVADEVIVSLETENVDAFSAAVDLADRYRLDVLNLYDQLRELYGDQLIPIHDVGIIAEQIENQTRAYEKLSEEYELALAVLRPEGFRSEMQATGRVVYTADITYPKDKEHLLVSMARLSETNPAGFGFHYDPYNFDSSPEKIFFEDLLAWLNMKPEDVEDAYFTGGITDPNKTDFTVQYRGKDDHWHRYTPDFIIRMRGLDGQPLASGRVMIVEIKSESARADEINGEHGRKALALREWETLNPDVFKYEMVFASRDTIPPERTRAVRTFINGESR